MNQPVTPHVTLPVLLHQPLRLLIDGAWQAAADGALLDVINPSDGEIIARAAAGGAADIDDAVGAARHAFDRGPWSQMKPAVRARLLWTLADLIDRHADELALLETLNTGKPLKAARAFDVTMAAEALRYNAGWCTKLEGATRSVSLPGDWHTYTLRRPLGVAGLIVPWNVPLAMAVGKIAPALAAGCTVVLKPAELTPLTAMCLGELVLQAGFPPGVVNIVTGLGSEAGQALVDHPDVDKVSFTGSTAVGRQILAACAGNFKRLTLELGGKSPVFIFADADIPRATDAAARGIFGNSGQVCAAGVAAVRAARRGRPGADWSGRAREKTARGPWPAGRCRDGPADQPAPARPGAGLRGQRPLRRCPGAGRRRRPARPGLLR